MTGYRFAIENGEQNCREMMPLYTQHYSEMQERLAGQGINIPPFKPRLDVYFSGMNAGYILNYVVRTSDGEPVGYSNIYITNDMHNSELIAQEDTIFILKAHRNGVGKNLVKFILDDLRNRGVKRVNVTAMTDLRVAKLWERMGFKHVAQSMTYIF